MKYDKATQEFNEALNLSKESQKPVIMHRIAWCYFHKDHQVEATNVLRSILVAKNTSPSLREEASRDYATFLAQGHVGPEQIKDLFDLSPESARSENLHYFASELDRLGKKKASLLVMATIGQTRENF